uniref:Putative secreted protein n=1 Tax=Ixodes ricinus TaxID=34613 RepID=A0A6B0UQN3_IXORI
MNFWTTARIFIMSALIYFTTAEAKETLRHKQIKLKNQSFEDKIVMAYNSCMNGADELHQLNSTLKRFGIDKWPMMLDSAETIKWTDIYRKTRIEGDMSFIFSINLQPYLRNTSQRAISVSNLLNIAIRF